MLDSTITIVDLMVSKMAKKFIDIGINLTDAQFRGIYHGKQAHESDLVDVIDRARQSGMTKMLVTGSTLSDSKEALELCTSYSQQGILELYSTVGVHPCQAAEYDAEFHGDLNPIKALAQSSSYVKAFGEIGLDYDRLHYSPADVQRKYFKNQLDIASELKLPLFLHSRAAADDFVSILSPYITEGKLPRGGVVHSFTGTLEEARQVLDLGLYIGINGCSLKTEENLAVVKQIPLDKILLETDGPWCEIRPSHSSYKYLAKPPLPYKAVKKDKQEPGSLIKGRCEPCAISLVADVIAGVKEISVTEVIETAYSNTVKLFFSEE